MFVVGMWIEVERPKVIFNVVAMKQPLNSRHLSSYWIFPVSLTMKSADMLKPANNLPLLMNICEYSDEVLTLSIMSRN